MGRLDAVKTADFSAFAFTTAFLFSFAQLAISFAGGFDFLDDGFDFLFDFFALVFVSLLQVFTVFGGEISALRAELVAELADGEAEVGAFVGVEAEGEEGGTDLVDVCAFEVAGFDGID